MKPMFKGNSVEKVQYGMSIMHADDTFRTVATADPPCIYLIQNKDDQNKDDIEMKLPTNCPNCNAPTTQSGICEYCGTNIKMYIKHKIDSTPPVFYPL